jgi:hypothetical protein
VFLRARAFSAAVDTAAIEVVLQCPVKTLYLHNAMGEMAVCSVVLATRLAGSAPAVLLLVGVNGGVLSGQGLLRRVGHEGVDALERV